MQKGSGQETGQIRRGLGMDVFSYSQLRLPLRFQRISCVAPFYCIKITKLCCVRYFQRRYPQNSEADNPQRKPDKSLS